MHFIFQFIILESNTTLFKMGGQGGEGVELHTKKNQDAMSYY